MESQYGPCQNNARGRREVSSHDSGKVTGAEGIPWCHDTAGERVETVTIGQYHKIYFLRDNRRRNQVAGYNH